jgi:hypothetical protein
MKDRVILTGTHCPLPLPVLYDVHVLMKDSVLWPDGFPALFLPVQVVRRTAERYRQGCVLGLCLECHRPTLIRSLSLYQKESSFQVLYCVGFKICLSVHVALSVVSASRQGLLNPRSFKARLLFV